MEKGRKAMPLRDWGEGVKGNDGVGRGSRPCVYFSGKPCFFVLDLLCTGLFTPFSLTHTQTVLCLHSGGLNGNGCLPMVLVIQGERGGGERCGEVN